MSDNIKVAVQVESNLKDATTQAKKFTEELKKAAEIASSIKIPSMQQAASGGTRTSSQTKAYSQAAAGSRSSSENVEYGIARAGGAGTGAASRDFAKQAQGLGGLVHLYATFAANLFAVGAAFTALKNAADTTNMIKGLDQLGAASGRNLGSLSKEVVSITDGAVSLREAMEAVGKATSAGMSNADMKRLAGGARNVSQALGVAMPDALSRLSRGITKLEPELLDELGIFVRVDKAASDYARNLGKPVTALTEFERRTAFATATLDQLDQKFGKIKMEANPYDKLLSGLKDIMQSGLEVVNKVLGPLVKMLAESPTGLATALAAVGALLLKQALPTIGNIKENMQQQAEMYRKLANAKVKDAENALSKEVERNASAAKKKAEDSIKATKEQLLEEHKLRKIASDSLASEAQANAEAARGQIEALVSKGLFKKKSKALEILDKNYIDITEKDLSTLAKIEKQFSTKGDNNTAAIYAQASELLKKHIDLEKEHQRVVAEGEKIEEHAKVKQAALEAEYQKNIAASRAEIEKTVASLPVSKAAHDANAAAKGREIAANASYTTSILGMKAGWKELNEEIKKAKASGEIGKIQGGLATLRGSFGILTQGISSFLNTWGVWGQAIAAGGLVLGLIYSKFTETAEESVATSKAIEALESSVKNLTRTLEYVSKLDPLAAFSIESVQAKATAIYELSQAITEAVTKSIDELNKMGKLDNFVNHIKDIFNYGIEDALAESMSSSIVKAFKNLDTPEAKEAAKKISSLLGGIDIRDLKKVDDAIESLAKDGIRGKQALKDIAEEFSKVAKAGAVAAAKGTEFKQALQEASKQLKTFSNSFIPSDAFSKVGLSIIEMASKGNIALQEPIQSLRVMAEVAKDASNIAFFPSDIGNKLSDASAGIEKLTSDMASNSKAIQEINDKTDEFSTRVAELNNIKLNRAFTRPEYQELLQLQDALKQLQNLGDKEISVRITLEEKVREAQKLYSTAMRESFVYGAQIVSSRLAVEWAKVGTAVGNAVANILGDSREGINKRAEMESRAITAQIESAKMQQALIKAQYHSAMKQSENSLANAENTLATDMLANEMKTLPYRLKGDSVPEEFAKQNESYLKKKNDLEVERKKLERTKEAEGSVVGKKGSSEALSGKVLSGEIDGSLLNYALQLEASMANIKGLKDQLGAIELTRATNIVAANWKDAITVLKIEEARLDNLSKMSTTGTIIEDGTEKSLEVLKLQNKQYQEIYAYEQKIAVLDEAYSKSKDKDILSRKAKLEETEGKPLRDRQKIELENAKTNYEIKSIKEASLNIDKQANLLEEKRKDIADFNIEYRTEELSFKEKSGILLEDEIALERIKLDILKETESYTQKVNKLNIDYAKKMSEYGQELRTTPVGSAREAELRDLITAEAKIYTSRLENEDSIHNLRLNNLNNIASIENVKWLSKGLADSVVTALEEGGKAGAKKLRDIIKARLREKFVISLETSITSLLTGNGSGGSFLDILGGLFSKVIDSGNSGSSSSGGMVGNVLSIGKTAWDVWKGNTGGVIGAGVSQVGSLTGSASMQAIGAGMQMTAAQAAAASTLYMEAATGANIASANLMTAATAAEAEGQIALAALLKEQAAQKLVEGSTYTVAGEGLSTGASATTTIAWVAAIVMGMYMSSKAWQAGIRWENYAKEKGSEYDLEKYYRASKDKPMAALFGDDFVNSEFYAVMSGSALSAQIHMALKKALWGGDWQPENQPFIKGNFSDSGKFTGGQVGQQWKKDGGLFTSDKSEMRWNTLSDGVDTLLDNMYVSIKNNFLMLGKVFDDNTISDKIKDFSKNIEFNILDDSRVMFTKVSEELTASLGALAFPAINTIKSNSEKAKEILVGQMSDATTVGNAKLAESLKTQIEELDVQIKESWSTTFTRVLEETSAVGKIFEMLGTNLTTVFGKDNANNVLQMSNALVVLFGGLEAMNTSFNNYFSNFYTKAEQTSIGWSDMSKAFSSLNMKMPKTREEFRALVDSVKNIGTIDSITTLKALLDISPAFAKLTEAIEDTNNEINDFISSIGLGSSTFGELLKEGILGKLSVSDIGTKIVESIEDGINNALVDSFINNITAQINNSLITPLITAITTGTYTASLVSKQSMQGIIDTANTTAQALSEIFSNPEYARAMKEITVTISESIQQVVGVAQIASGSISKLLKDYQSRVKSSNDKVISAYKSQITTLESVKNKFKDFAKSLREFAQSLLTSNLSPLTPAEKYAESKKLLESTFVKAAAGDEDALSKLQGVSNDFLTISREYYASSEAYTTDFNRVQQILEQAASASDGLATTAETQIKLAQDQVLALGGILDNTGDIADSLEKALADAKAEKEAADKDTDKSVADALVAAFTTIDKDFSKGLTGAELVNSGLASDGDLKDIYARLDANTDGILTAAEVLARSSEDTTFTLTSLETIFANLRMGKLDGKGAKEYIDSLIAANASKPEAESTLTASSGGSSLDNTITSIIDNAYNKVLGRTAYANEKDYLLNAIKDGTQSNITLMRDMLAHYVKNGTVADANSAKAWVKPIIVEAYKAQYGITPRDEIVQTAIEGLVDDSIKLGELKEYFTTSINSAQEYSALLTSKFTSIDTNLDGFISKQELLAKEAGLTTAQLTSMYTMLDTNTDGQISQLEAIANANGKASFTLDSLVPINEAIKNNTMTTANGIAYLNSMIEANRSAGITGGDLANTGQGTLISSGTNTSTGQFINSKMQSTLGRQATSDEMSAILGYFSSGGMNQTTFQTELVRYMSQNGGAADKAAANDWMYAYARDAIYQAAGNQHVYTEDTIRALMNEILSGSINSFAGIYGAGSKYVPTEQPSYNYAGAAGGGSRTSPGIGLVGEQGPELLVTHGPSRIWSHEATKGMLNQGTDNTELIAEIRKLNAKIDSLEQTVARGDMMNVQATQQNTNEVAAAVENSASLTTHANRVKNRVTLV